MVMTSFMWLPPTKPVRRPSCAASPGARRKDNHELDATELHLVAADKHGNGQHAMAKGPGEIRLFSNNPHQAYPIKAIWEDTLTVDRVKENGLFDLLILNEEAVIQDDEHNQELHGERIEIMAEPAPAVAIRSLARRWRAGIRTARGHAHRGAPLPAGSGVGGRSQSRAYRRRAAPVPRGRHPRHGAAFRGRGGDRPRI